MVFFARMIVCLLFVCVSGNASAFIGAFWLGVDAKVETNVKIDQRVLDMINSLPVEVRKQIVGAANEVIEKIDQKFKDNLPLISAEIEKISLNAAIQWECTAKNVIDKFFSEFKATLPRWTIFADSCERSFVIDKVGPGPIEKINIAECWVYEALSEKPNSSPSIIAAKLSNLELMSTDAACRLRETQAASDMWKKSTDFSLRFSTWSTLQKICSDPKGCFSVRSNFVSVLLQSSDSRDIGNAKERFVSGRLKGEKVGCDLQCYEDALVDLYLAESEIYRNNKLREKNANALAQESKDLVTQAKFLVTEAKKVANAFEKLPEEEKKVDAFEKLSKSQENAKSAQEKLSDAREKSKNSIAMSHSVLAIAQSVNQEASDTDTLLADYEKLVATILEKEQKRQDEARRLAERNRERMYREIERRGVY